MGEKQTWQVLGEDEVHCGPYTAEQLVAFAQDGTIDRDSMVWTEGLEEWIPAGQVEGLFPLQVAAPLTAPPQGPRFVLTGQPREGNGHGEDANQDGCEQARVPGVHVCLLRARGGPIGAACV